jgi:5-methylthioadenosine/S-adenosylhomocysteine deaminase
MNRQVVRSRLVVTRWDAKSAALQRGAVYIENGAVKETGPFESLLRLHPESETIGDGTHLVIPGLVNFHSHGRGITTLRQGIPDDPGGSSVGGIGRFPCLRLL